MGDREDDIVELLWKSGQVVRSNETQPDPPLVGNASPNLFIQEDEMASWLQHPPLGSQGGFYSDLLYSHPQSSSSVSLAPPLPPPPSDLPTTTRTENFLNFAKLRDSMWIPAVGETTQVSSSATPSSSGTASCLTPAPPVIGRVSPTFVVPGLTRKEKTPLCEIAGTSSLGVCKVETEPIQVQPAMETDIADDRKRKDRDDDIEETEEARGSTSRKRSRAAEMHNISERRRREKINEKMKALQDLIPRCNKTDKASMLDDAVEYVKSLQLQLQIMSMGSGMMPMIYPPNMQQFMPHMARGMGMNRPPFIPFPGTPFPRQANMGDLGPSYPAPCYPFPNIQTSHSFGVHLPSQQPYPGFNQPQFLGYMNPYSQFAGLHQMQQPSPSQNQTSQLSFTHANTNKEHEHKLNG